MHDNNRGCELDRQRTVGTNYNLFIVMEQDKRLLGQEPWSTHRLKNASALDGDQGNGSHGIQDFMLQGDISDINRIASILAASHNTLESLTLTNTGANSDHWVALSDTHFPRLTKLSLRYLTLPENEWMSFFACRSNLVIFKYFIISLRRLNLDSMIEGISLLKHLEDLRITRLVNNVESDLWSNAHILSNNTSLRRLELTGINFSDDVLLSLWKTGPLTKLSVSFSPHVNYYITCEGLLKFTENLRTMNCRIKTLTFGNIGNMDDAVLEQLGHVQSLSMLYIRQCKKISDAGVMSFLRRDYTNKRIHVLGCPLTSRSGFWTGIDNPIP
ncbi:hypothetical protein BJV82DRAFT_582826 [Fennellomyces sp. T-0311]|nr:hypothetical protein BJV82DRAFT_582826 [Fennellomyces sp. T-0311]